MEESKKTDTIITLIPKGPMILRGSFEIKGVDGNKIEIPTFKSSEGVALCRCGKSQNKPMCDGSHTK